MLELLAFPSKKNLDHVQLHLKAMIKEDICSGDLCIFTNLSNNSATAATVWPIQQGEETHAFLSSNIRENFKLSLGERFSVSKFKGTIFDAATVTIQIGKGFQFYQKHSQYINLLLKKVLSKQLITKKDFIRTTIYGTPTKLKIQDINVNQDKKENEMVYKITKETKFELVKKEEKESNNRIPNFEVDLGQENIQSKQNSKKNYKKYSNSKIGGLKNQKKEILSYINLSLFNSNLFQDFGIKPPKGILLFGPPGTGKTLLAKNLAKKLKVNFFPISGASLASKYYGQGESKLESLFTKASKNSPSIIFIDEIDALGEKRLVQTLIQCIDNLEKNIVVIAATNRPNSLDLGIRRAGRLDKEIEIGIPTESERNDILNVLFSKIPNKLTEKEIESISLKVHGFVGADLSFLSKQSVINCLKRNNFENNDLDNCFVEYQDLKLACNFVKPSGMREILVDVPKVYWSDIGGNEEIKQSLKEAVLWPLMQGDAFKRMGIRAPKGVLLYGPPGNSKTLLAKALATEAGLNFIAVKGPELLSKWVGESEKAVQQIFSKAKLASPSIIFFDEIDGLASKRSNSGVLNRVLSQLLIEVDAIPGNQVTVIGATNRPDLIDEAMLRPGRFDRILEVLPPDFESRKKIFEIYLKKMPCELELINLTQLSENTEGFSGADISAICTEAAYCAMKNDKTASKITEEDLNMALKNFKNSKNNL